MLVMNCPVAHWICEWVMTVEMPAVDLAGRNPYCFLRRGLFLLRVFSNLLVDYRFVEFIGDTKEVNGSILWQAWALTYLHSWKRHTVDIFHRLGKYHFFRANNFASIGDNSELIFLRTKYSVNPFFLKNYNWDFSRTPALLRIKVFDNFGKFSRCNRNITLFVHREKGEVR